MAKDPLRFVVATVDRDDRTRELHLPAALDRMAARVNTLRMRDGLVALSFENNDWGDAAWLPPDAAMSRIKARMEEAHNAGVDAFVRGKRARRGPTFRLRSVEISSGAKFAYSGDMDAGLRRLCEDLWATFGADNSLSNGGVLVCRHISGSSMWSEHAFGAAIDLMIGSDMQLGDDIYRWLRSNEGQYGGYCECLWRRPGHFDHVHLALSPCHRGLTPPCA